MNPDPHNCSIQRAIEMGIPVVTFDSDAPRSGRHSFLATGNHAAGAMAARHLAKLLDKEGEVGLITLPGQLNHEQRAAGFKETIQNEFPKMKVAQVGNGAADQAKAAAATAGIIQANPGMRGIFATDATSGVGCATAVKESGNTGKIKVITFDTDKGTLDAVKQGIVDASIAQGTWNMGFWSLQYLFQLRHGLVNPVSGWKEKGISPLPVFVDTGVSVVTRENVDAFYVK